MTKGEHRIHQTTNSKAVQSVSNSDSSRSRIDQIEREKLKRGVIITTASWRMQEALLPQKLEGPGPPPESGASTGGSWSCQTTMNELAT